MRLMIGISRKLKFGSGIEISNSLHEVPLRLLVLLLLVLVRLLLISDLPNSEKVRIRGLYIVRYTQLLRRFLLCWN
jgi:hypothetical protein